jgi:DNA-binding phage protein
MTSISTTSLQQFSCLLNRTSSNSISDEYKKNLYLARIAREERRESTQNYVESAAETTEEEQNISNISDEVITSQSTEYKATSPRVNPTYPTTNANDSIQTYDGNINQLKARKNSLQQELNRLNQGTNQAASSNQEGERETAQDVESASSPANGMTAEESPLASVLKRQIDEIEQELNKNGTISAISENLDSTNGLNLSQMRQKKTKLEQQLKSMEDKVANQSASVQNNNRTTIGETLEQQGDSPYQNHMEELRIQQEIRTLESEINILERKKITSKTQAALNEIKNVSNEATTTENHLINIEI